MEERRTNAVSAVFANGVEHAHLLRKEARDWLIQATRLRCCNAVSVGSQAATAVIRPESDVTGRMNPSPPNINPNSVEGAVPGSASNMNATLSGIQAFNPPAMQTLQQVVLDGVSVSDDPGLGATSQHAGLPHTSSLGMQPPQMFPGLVAAQMKQFVEQRGPAQSNHERMSQRQWSGTITWWGTDTTRNETRELRAQVTATASKGDPCAIFLMGFPLVEDLYSLHPSRLTSTWPDALLLSPGGPAVSMDKLDDWIRKNDPVVMRIRPKSVMDLNSYGQLVKLLEYKSCVSHQYTVESSSNLLDSMPLRVGIFQERAIQ